MVTLYIYKMTLRHTIWELCACDHMSNVSCCNTHHVHILARLCTSHLMKLIWTDINEWWHMTMVGTVGETHKNQHNKVKPCLREHELSYLLMILLLMWVKSGPETKQCSNKSDAIFLNRYGLPSNKPKDEMSFLFAEHWFWKPRQMLTMYIHKQNNVNVLHSMCRYKT